MCIPSLIEIIVLYRLGTVLLECRRAVPVGRLKNQYFHFKQYCNVVSTSGPTRFECIGSKNAYNAFRVYFLSNDISLV